MVWALLAFMWGVIAVAAVVGVRRHARGEDRPVVDPEPDDVDEAQAAGLVLAAQGLTAGAYDRWGWLGVAGVLLVPVPAVLLLLALAQELLLAAWEAILGG